MFGVEYISQFINMKFNRDEEDFAYRVYITEWMRLYTENKRLAVSFRDIVRPAPEKPQKTPDEIKAGILAEFKRIGGAKSGD